MARLCATRASRTRSRAKNTLSRTPTCGRGAVAAAALGNGDFRWAIFLEDDSDTKSWTPRQYTERRTFLGANVTWKLPEQWTLTAGANNLIAKNPEFERSIPIQLAGVWAFHNTSHPA